MYSERDPKTGRFTKKKKYATIIHPKIGTHRAVGFENELQVNGLVFSMSWRKKTKIKQLEKLIARRDIFREMHTDGGGIEFTTKPIKASALYQKRTMKYIEEYYENLKKATTPISTGGTHIHISVLKTDHENIILNAVIIAQEFFTQLQKISGRQVHWASKPPEEHSMEGTKRRLSRMSFTANGQKVYNRAYWMITPTNKGTLEFRGPMGSNNMDEILAWQELFANIVKEANRESVKGLQFAQLLQGERISKYINEIQSGNITWRKLSAEELLQPIKK